MVKEMGGNKNKSEGLGRALIRQNNQQVQQSKDRSKALRQQRRVLESVSEVTVIEAVIEQAEEADRIYLGGNPVPNLIINLDSDAPVSAEERVKQQKEEEALHASSLRVPRRPPWNERMSIEELDANERQAFLSWRRNLVELEENEKLVLTPFEKNLDIWRQLWRVLERSDLGKSPQLPKSQSPNKEIKPADKDKLMQNPNEISDDKHHC